LSESLIPLLRALLFLSNINFDAYPDRSHHVPFYYTTICPLLYYTSQYSSSKSISISSSISIAFTIIASSSSEEMSFRANQLPMHSNLWRFSGDNLRFIQHSVASVKRENCQQTLQPTVVFDVGSRDRYCCFEYLANDVQSIQIAR
jgi:hypothetical protein